MPVERRGQAIRVMINLVNWQQEEPTGCGGGRQLSMDGTSRVTGDCHARFCERLGVKFPGPTRPGVRSENLDFVRPASVHSQPSHEVKGEAVICDFPGDNHAQRMKLNKNFSKTSAEQQR